MAKSSMTQAEKMCESVSDELRPQAIVLAEAIIALQKKIKEQTPIYNKQELAQEVTVGTGETILRQNPIVQEYRATVRDYTQALEKFNNLLKRGEDPQRRIDKNAKLHVVGNSKWKKQA